MLPANRAALRRALKKARKDYLAAFGHRPELVIGILKMGGHGDFLQQLVFAKAVRKRWGPRKALIVLFTRLLAPTLAFVGGRPYADHVSATLFESAAGAMRLGPIIHMPLASGGWRGLVSELAAATDCLWDVQYVAASYWRDLGRHLSEQVEFDARLKLYSRFYSGFPQLSNPELHTLRMTQWELLADSTGLAVSEDDLVLEAPSLGGALAELGDYATIHNGAGGNAILKRMPPAHMNAIARVIAERGLKVVQLGKKNNAKEAPVLGAVDMRGLPMRVSMGILARARLHVDVEGGLVYVAKGLGVPRAVFIGPTSPFVFGFADSYNLYRTASGGCSVLTPEPYPEPRCRPCWWGRPLWDRECPKGLPCCGNFPPTPEEAVRWIERVLDDLERRTGAPRQNAILEREDGTCRA